MTLRLSALFENKVDELLVNFYRNRSGSGRRTRQRSRRVVVENEPGTSGVSNPSPPRRAAPRARPELIPRASTRITANRDRYDEGEPSTSTNSTDGLRMKISLSRGSVVSTTGLEDTNGGSSCSRSTGISSRLRGTTNNLDDAGNQRTRTRSTVRTSFRDSLSSSSSMVSETAPEVATGSQNGVVPRYSTRSRVPATRLKLNGVTTDHESEDDEEEEEEEEEASEETGEESSEDSESGSPQRGRNTRSSRSGKTPVTRKSSSKKSANSKGKQVVNRPVRTRASSRYDDSASESDDDDTSSQPLDISSRGRIRRRAFKMLDYVN